MKKLTAIILFSFALASCDTWGIPPQPFPVWTPIPSRTPAVVTATPVIITLPFTITPTLEINTATPTLTETPTLTYTPVNTETPTPFSAMEIDVLGCNTSLDISHGMGEVTNAFVTIKNTGTLDLPNACALLRAIDEDREHPDKKVCIPLLPAGNQVSLKLTVDSAYKQDTVIQVDGSSSDVLLKRVDQQSCRDIGLFGGAPADIGVIKPIP